MESKTNLLISIDDWPVSCLNLLQFEPCNSDVVNVY